MRGSWSAPSLSTYTSSLKQSRFCTPDALSLPTVLSRTHSHPLWGRPDHATLATIGSKIGRATGFPRLLRQSVVPDVNQELCGRTADIGLLFIKKDGTYGSYEEDPAQDHCQPTHDSSRSVSSAINHWQYQRPLSSSTSTKLENVCSLDPLVEATRPVDRVITLVEENTKLRRAKNILEQDLETWKAKVRDAQAMQEMAVAAFQENTVLESENLELRRVVLAFAEASPSGIIQELRVVIRTLSHQVALHKRREADLGANENRLKDAENSNILKAMRRETTAIKRRSTQYAQTNVLCNNNAISNQMIDRT